MMFNGDETMKIIASDNGIRRVMRQFYILRVHVPDRPEIAFKAVSDNRQKLIDLLHQAEALGYAMVSLSPTPEPEIGQ